MAGDDIIAQSYVDYSQRACGYSPPTRTGDDRKLVTSNCPSETA